MASLVTFQQREESNMDSENTTALFWVQKASNFYPEITALTNSH